MPYIAAIALALLPGCWLDNGLPRNSCRTTADCVGQNTCVQGVCVGQLDAGFSICETFPPQTCARPEGALHPIDASELQRLLPGRWLWCSGNSDVGEPAQPGVIGIEFNGDATLWWFLYDDGTGVPTPRANGGVIGTVEFVAGLQSSVALTLSFSGATESLTFSPAFSDGPPLHLRLMNGSSNAYYIFDDSGCVQHLGTAGVDLSAPPVYDLASNGSLGGPCDPTMLLPTSCPAIGRVACSVCVPSTTMDECLQPCQMSSSNCPAPQNCVSVSRYARAGDCAGFDGVCM